MERHGEAVDGEIRGENEKKALMHLGATPRASNSWPPWLGHTQPPCTSVARRSTHPLSSTSVHGPPIDFDSLLLAVEHEEKVVEASEARRRAVCSHATRTHLRHLTTRTEIEGGRGVSGAVVAQIGER